MMVNIDKDIVSRVNEKLLNVSGILFKTDEKELFRATFNASSFVEFRMKERLFYIVQTRLFQTLITDGLYLDIIKCKRNFFGTGNAEDVLTGMLQYFQEHGMASSEWTIERFAEYLRDENFAYVVEIRGNEVSDKILRLDFFRKLDWEGENRVFTGGLFHLFKHFSLEDYQSLSISSQGLTVRYWDYIVDKLISAFFFEEISPVKGKNLKYEVFSRYDDQKQFHFIFHQNQESHVYFVDTMFVQNMKQNRTLE